MDDFRIIYLKSGLTLKELFKAEGIFKSVSSLNNFDLF